MSTNNLLMRIYKTQEHEACFHLRVGKQVSKITGLIAILPFIAEMKQLAKAIDAGATLNCALPLTRAKGREYELTVCLDGPNLVLELALNGQCCFRHQSTAKRFIASVDGMLSALPKFF